MAASDARPIPRKNAAFRVTFPIWDADGDLVTGATSPDSEVSIDGGTFADCANEATEIATASGVYFLDLTAGEMNGDTIAIIVKTGTAGAKTTPIILYPEEAGDIRVDVTMISGDATAADNAEAFFDGTGYAGTGNVIPTVTTTVNLTTNNDKTGYGLSAAAVQAIWDALTSALTTAGSIGKRIADFLTGDAFVRLGAPAGASVSADVAAIKTQTAAIETDTQDIQARLPAALVSGRMDSSVGAMAADVVTAAAIAPDAIGASELAASAVTEIQAGLATQASVDTIDDFLDTEVAAIKAKTDNLPSDPADASDIAAAFSTVNTNLSTVASYIDTEVAAIKAKTDLIPAGGPAAATDYTAARAAKLDNLDVVLSTRATPAQVNAEVLDVLNVDTFAEPAAAPVATTTLQAMLHWLFSLSRNERRTTATSDALRNDANNATIATSTLSDDGTTFTRGEYT